MTNPNRRPGRRKYQPTPDIDQRINHAIQLHQQAKALDAEYRQTITQLADKTGDAVPIAYLAQRLGVERKVIYRAAGHRMP
ncbi:hypothetical protein [Melissospora conviva]|uniref:hypothetical protein n=1 Tax=Melissospora conviva TaxID=3388432 RepID=UPI003C2395A8